MIRRHLANLIRKAAWLALDFAVVLLIFISPFAVAVGLLALADRLLSGH